MNSDVTTTTVNTTLAAVTTTTNTNSTATNTCTITTANCISNAAITFTLTSTTITMFLLHTTTSVKISLFYNNHCCYKLNPLPIWRLLLHSSSMFKIQFWVSSWHEEKDWDIETDDRETIHASVSSIFQQFFILQRISHQDIWSFSFFSESFS